MGDFKLKDLEIWIMEYDENGNLNSKGYKYNDRFPRQLLDKTVMDIIAEDNYIEIYVD